MVGLDARSLLESLVGQRISTVTGRPNAVIGLTDTDVAVGTDRSPGGQLVPIGAVQSGLERLYEVGELEVHPRSIKSYQARDCVRQVVSGTPSVIRAECFLNG